MHTRIISSDKSGLEIARRCRLSFGEALRIVRPIVMALGAVSVLLIPGFAGAQTASWPTKPVKIVVGYPPSGHNDTVGRLLAERLSVSLGQQVIIENKAGASGRIGALYVVRAEPDGYTFLLAGAPETAISPVTVKNMEYQPLKDLQPIRQVSMTPHILVAYHGFPPNTVSELIAYVKANPGKVSFSSAGNATSNHLVGELFNMIAGIKTLHVPYKGSAPSIRDLAGGQVQYTFETLASTLSLIKAGKLKAIAVAASHRLSSLSTVPTMEEAGLPGFVAGSWTGLVAPANTPQPIIRRLNAEVTAALSSPEMKTAYENLNINVLPGEHTPEQFGRFIQSESAKWQKVAERIGLEPQ